MITSMAEECGDPTTKLPEALSLSVPVGGLAGLFFVCSNIKMGNKGVTNSYSES